MIENLEWYEKLDRCHPYPAKYPLSLAEEYIQKYTKEGDVVYDPFSGSGTTLLAATHLNRIAFGTDINAIAILLSKFKLMDYDWEDQSILLNFINKLDQEGIPDNYTQYYSYSSIDHWFCHDAIHALSYIKNTINSEFADNEKLRIFANVAFSAIVNSVSNQESDTRYAAVEKEWITIQSVLDVYSKKYRQFLKIVRGIQRDKIVLQTSAVYLHDAKHASEMIRENSVDFIVTSPPYPNTYDYYLYHKHRMLWLGYDFTFSKENEIGSRNEFSSKKQPVSNFTADLMEIFSESNKLLKKGGHVVIVIGDGVVRGNLYDSREHTIQIGNTLGWKLITSSYTSLDDTSRSFNKGFRTQGKKEHVLEFQKQ